MKIRQSTQKVDVDEMTHITRHAGFTWKPKWDKEREQGRKDTPFFSLSPGLATKSLLLR